MSLKKLCLLTTSIVLLQGCVGLAAVGIVGGANVAADNRTVGQQLDDQTIEIAIYNAINKNEVLADQTNIQVTSINGSVLVVGQAPSTHLKELAISTINSVKNIKRLHNQLRIANVTSTATKANDVLLTSKVKANLFKSDEVEAVKIKVVTENAEVFLMGLVERGQANKAVDIARNVSGVNRVYKAFEYID